MVVTGEGFLDTQSLDGKVVGGICELAGEHAKPVVVIVGAAEPSAREQLWACATSAAPVTVVELVATFGETRAFAEPARCIEQAAREALRAAT